MRHAYSALLLFYPVEYRHLFGEEMLNTFEQAAGDWRARGTLAFWWFTTWELTGLLHGLIGEWIAKHAAGDEYLRPWSAGKVPAKAAELEKLCEQLVRRMEFAIAHHDFPKARFYSAAEEKTRRRLERLLGTAGQ